MRCSLNVRTVLFLTIAAAYIVQARKPECMCGNLGSGINPCRCGEVVVKAAKVQKPLFYASPEAINQAAAAREIGMRRFSAGPVCGNVVSFPKYNRYTSGTYSTSTSSGSSSASSGSISSSASSVGSFGEPFGGSNGFRYSFYPSTSNRLIDSGCGCGKKSTSESLETRDLLSHNIHGKVVPSFSPIGDLCYPSSHNEKYQVTTKVTPAYPGKIKCSPPIPYEVCLKILNGQIDEAGLRRLSQTITHSDMSAADRFRVLNGLTSGSASGTSSSLDRYISNNVNNVDRYNSVRGYDNSGSFERYSSKYDNLVGFGSYQGSSIGSLGQLSSNNFATTHGTYGNSFATSNNVASALLQGSTGSYKSNCDAADFGDDPELPEDYSYPRLPADPVSLTLAYKNLFPQTVMYNRRTFVPEDKLAFGHRTVPIESLPSKKIVDVPEEKLQILDKPVVELKPILPTPVAFGVYNEQEEAKLAELEAIERERINQEEIAEQPQQNFITYGDLGYVPINGAVSSGSIKSATHSTIDAFNAEDGEAAGYGPLGPPMPDYVPGNVVINRELVKTEGEVEGTIHSGDTEEVYVRHYSNDEGSEEEDDIDGPTAGIFARLKSVARKHNPTCLQ
ncbi:hypothetical protein X777_15655 [Ooceraea biroi]|uniref:Uncharacterized protein n=1 Tax=Ooceraea biroi TaxID=2015173 RepID=A0A026VUX2_OOCBI|nr:hypothetical protein X777_15655 [Ooceraea biroi]